MTTLSKDALLYLKALLGGNGADSDVCTNVARYVMDTLGKGGDSLRQDNVATYLAKGFQSWPTIQDGLYNLTISMLDGQVWQHGLVIFKRKNDVMLLHGWVGNYSLAEWLDSSNSKKIEEPCFSLFSPASKSYNVDAMAHWFQMLASLPTIFKEANYEKFEWTCGTLFGIKFGKVDQMTINQGMKQKYDLNYTWKFRFLEDPEKLS